MFRIACSPSTVPAAILSLMLVTAPATATYSREANDSPDPLKKALEEYQEKLKTKKLELTRVTNLLGSDNLEVLALKKQMLEKTLALYEQELIKVLEELRRLKLDAKLQMDPPAALKRQIDTLTLKQDWLGSEIRSKRKELDIFAKGLLAVTELQKEVEQAEKIIKGLTEGR